MKRFKFTDIEPDFKPMAGITSTPDNIMKEKKLPDKVTNIDLSDLVAKAAGLPGVKINREEFLKKEFGAPKYAGILAAIIKNGPNKAGVDQNDLLKHAKGVINFETTKATAISAAAGLPGGLAMIGTIPADTAQFYGHVLRVIQKLMYLYGWQDVGSMDEGTKNILIIFLGAMSGVEVAQKAIGNLCKQISSQMATTIAAKALTKTTLYPVVKKVCAQIGIKMTKQVFAKGVAQAVPVVGAVVSGGLTVATFKPMSHKLLKILAENS